MSDSWTADLTGEIGSTANKDSCSAHPKVNKCTSPDRWFYPAEMKNDLQGVDIPAAFIPEILASAWEYTRIIVPHFTNHTRYIALCRLATIAIVAEFKGSLFDVKSGDHVLGYNIEALLRTLFDGTIYHHDMCREFRLFLYLTPQKSSNKGYSYTFTQYVNSLAYSPKTWFRMRDSDALIRFTFAAALACNDYDNIWFEESELQLLAEIAVTMYDAVSYYKHKSEGEVHNTFAYLGDSPRKECYRRCREILWALDVAWANVASHRCIVNMLHNLGGPLHMMCRRSRFVEEDLTIGHPDTSRRQQEARRNLKLWHRIESRSNQTDVLVDETMMEQEQRQLILTQTLQELEEQQILFSGFSKILLDSQSNRCDSCLYPQSGGIKNVEQFSSVELCDECRSTWETYVRKLPNRSTEVFTFLHIIQSRETRHLKSLQFKKKRPYRTFRDYERAL